MMFCKYCGTQVPEIARFCPVCGKPVGERLYHVEEAVSAEEAPPLASEQMSDTDEAVPQSDTVSEKDATDAAAEDTTEETPQPDVELDSAKASAPPGAESVERREVQPQSDDTRKESAIEQIVSKKREPQKAHRLWLILGAVAICAILIAVLLPKISEQDHVRRYNKGAEYLEEGAYEQAREVFLSLGEYEDASILAAYAEKGVTYAAAKESMAQGEFEAARGTLEMLGGFKDSEALIEECKHALLYEEGKRLFEAGEYASAVESLEAAEGYEDSEKILEECRPIMERQEILEAMEIEDYARALTLLESGAAKDMESREETIAECKNGIKYNEAVAALDEELNYTAYKLFHELGSYRDAASRAEACALPKPSTGEIYRNSAYGSSGCALKINPNTSGGACTYFKVYAVSGSDEILVSCIFIGSGDTARIKLPAGTYVLKTATGSGSWYGEKEMFGAAGVYQRLKSSGTSDQFKLDRGGDYVLTMRVNDGNVASKNENMNTF